jgi:hypothetical protein
MAISTMLENKAVAARPATAERRIGRKATRTGCRALLLAGALMAGNLAAQSLSTMVDTVNQQLVLYFSSCYFDLDPSWCEVAQIVWPYSAVSYPLIASTSTVLGNGWTSLASYSNPNLPAGGPKTDAPELYFLSGASHVMQVKGGNSSPPIDLTMSTVGAPRAAGATGLSGFFDSCAQSDNIVYIGDNQHIIILSGPLDGTAPDGWTALNPSGDLTVITGTPNALFGSQVIAYASRLNSARQSQEIFYIDTNSHVHELWRWSGCKGGNGFDGWHNTDLNIANGNDAPNVSGEFAPQFAAFFDTNANTDVVFYVDVNGDLRELLFPDQYNVWQNLKITGNTGASAPSTGPYYSTQLAAHENTITGTEEVFWTTASGNVYLASTASTYPPSWSNYSITGAAVAPPSGPSCAGSPLAVPGTPLATDINLFYNNSGGAAASCAVGSTCTDELYYIGAGPNGTNNVLLELWTTGAQKWYCTDLTTQAAIPFSL